jgi:hypothetical protein
MNLFIKSPVKFDGSKDRDLGIEMIMIGEMFKK